MCRLNSRGAEPETRGPGRRPQAAEVLPMKDSAVGLRDLSHGGRHERKLQRQVDRDEDGVDGAGSRDSCPSRVSMAEPSGPIIQLLLD